LLDETKVAEQLADSGRRRSHVRGMLCRFAWGGQRLLGKDWLESRSLRLVTLQLDKSRPIP
jgi:hypothetical protein